MAELKWTHSRDSLSARSAAFKSTDKIGHVWWIKWVGANKFRISGSDGHDGPMLKSLPGGKDTYPHADDAQAACQAVEDRLCAQRSRCTTTSSSRSTSSFDPIPAQGFPKYCTPGERHKEDYAYLVFRGADVPGRLVSKGGRLYPRESLVYWDDVIAGRYPNEQMEPLSVADALGRLEKPMPSGVKPEARLVLAWVEMSSKTIAPSQITDGRGPLIWRIEKVFDGYSIKDSSPELIDNTRKPPVNPCLADWRFVTEHTARAGCQRREDQLVAGAKAEAEALRRIDPSDKRLITLGLSVVSGHRVEHDICVSSECGALSSDAIDNLVAKLRRKIDTELVAYKPF